LVQKIISLLLVFFLFIFQFLINSPVFADSPSGNDWFEIRVIPSAGADDTGDGGSGNAVDYNYFYVDQTFDGNIYINSNGTTTSNIWVDYDSDIFNVNSISTADYFNSWKNQTINSGRVKSTGYNYPVVLSSGVGAFGTLSFTAKRPTSSNYGINNSSLVDINTGTFGASGESNIAVVGQDILDDAEDFHLHIWADTKKPYINNPLPINGATAVPVDAEYSFDIIDSLHGEGDDSGVGTGVDINSSSAHILFNDQKTSSDFSSFSVYTCSGVFGTNLCSFTVNPPPLTNFSGDTRHFKYGTTYTVTVNGYQDLASSNQNQLGDANGPNIMNETSFTFTTVSDEVAPRLYNILPLSGSNNNPLDTVIFFDVTDRQTYPDGISGSMVDSSTCRVDISSASFGSQTFKSGDSSVSVSDIDYGYSFIINPSQDFNSNEIVNVRIYGCSDTAGNAIADENYTFNIVILDTDGDGILDDNDNCPSISNVNQVDIDNDGIGDVCDDDIDGDGILNTPDNCPLIANPLQKDIDNDGIGDVCDNDHDNDAILNGDDNCMLIPNMNQVDMDNDGIGDVCDEDMDGDGILNTPDNCPLIANPLQEDFDDDGIGDVCDEDMDGDGILNTPDNCPLIANPLQEDFDDDGLGNACDSDIDNDTIINEDDNCVYVINPYQEDEDNDGIGDVCDISMGEITFEITARPEHRFIIDGVPNLTLDGVLQFYNNISGDVVLQNDINLDSSGVLNYVTDKLQIGNYSVSLKGNSHLNSDIHNISIGEESTVIELDYTFAGTKNLIAGDIYNDNIINSFDITTMLLTYWNHGTYSADLNKDEYVNASDIALLILNYFKKGDDI